MLQPRPLPQRRPPRPPPPIQPRRYLLRGEYLARAGDCVACHTEPNGRPFAGGRAMPTPFGNLYVPNITPDDETGIGQWTADEFYRMMHTGVSRDGALLYPAMPFASYTKVTREDCDAIYAYLMSVPPVRQQNRPHELRFPFNKRELLIGWRALYFKEGEYVPDPKQIGAMEPRRLSRGRARALRDVPHRDQRARRVERVEGVRRRHDSEPELVCAVAHFESRGGPRQLER